MHYNQLTVTEASRIAYSFRRVCLQKCLQCMPFISIIRPEGSRLLRRDYSKKYFFEPPCLHSICPTPMTSCKRPLFGIKFQRVDPPRLFSAVLAASNPLGFKF